VGAPGQQAGEGVEQREEDSAGGHAIIVGGLQGRVRECGYSASPSVRTVTPRLTAFGHDGLTFDVDDEGPPTGRPALLLHGFPQDHTAWDGVAGLLHATGLRTLAPDLRGYSPGARPTGRRAYTLSALTGDVLALLDAAGADRAHVVGHDWGGALAWALAGLHPDRVATLTVLSTPHPRAMTHAVWLSTQALRSWYMGFFQLPWLPELVVPARLAGSLHASGLPSAQAAHYAARMREPGALRGALAWYRAAVFDLTEPTPRAAVPTTYVWGRHDLALGRAAARTTADFVDAEYLFIELDAGHWLPETRPEEVARAVTERAATVSG